MAWRLQPRVLSVEQPAVKATTREFTKAAKRKKAALPGQGLRRHATVVVRGQSAGVRLRTPSGMPGSPGTRPAIFLAPRDPTTLIEVVCSVANDRSDRGATAPQVGDHSVFKGPEPIVERCADEKKSEAEAIVDWIKMLQLDCGVSTHEICITPNKPSIRQAITSAGLPTKELKPRKLDPGSDEPGIRMGTMKRIKGLEFRAVAMACSDEADAINDLSNADVRERYERYVAATRAVKYLLIAAKA